VSDQKQNNHGYLPAGADLMPAQWDMSRIQQNISRAKVREKFTIEKLKGTKYNNKLTYDALDKLREREQFIAKSKSYYRFNDDTQLQHDIDYEKDKIAQMHVDAEQEQYLKLHPKPETPIRDKKYLLSVKQNSQINNKVNSQYRDITGSVNYINRTNETLKNFW
jgi:hypothetical protein